MKSHQYWWLKDWFWGTVLVIVSFLVVFGNHPSKKQMEDGSLSQTVNDTAQHVKVLEIIQ
jgi:hypothetical protein